MLQAYGHIRAQVGRPPVLIPNIRAPGPHRFEQNVIGEVSTESRSGRAAPEKIGHQGSVAVLEHIAAERVPRYNVEADIVLLPAEPPRFHIAADRAAIADIALIDKGAVLQ